MPEPIVPPAPSTATASLIARSGAYEGVRVRPDPLTRVERRQRLQLLLAQLEVEHVDVLFDPLWPDRLCDHHVAQLRLPAEDRLGWRLAVRACDLADRLILQLKPSSKRAPGLG